MTLLIDSHLDLSWNALSWDRDLTRSLDEINNNEKGMSDSAARGKSVINFDELNKANVALCLGTLLARTLAWEKRKKPSGEMASVTGAGIDGPKRIDLDFNSQSIAHATAHGQLAWYKLLERQGYVKMIKTRQDLDKHWQIWKADNNTNKPLGIILAMEGADPITTVDELEYWHNKGLRSLGPVHYGKSKYAVGTGFDGPLTKAGRSLIKQMDKLGMILDVTHLSDISMTEALDIFSGQVIASHHNCRALVPGDRQLTDEQIKKLIKRDAVIGSAFDNWMLHPNWKTNTSLAEMVSLEDVANHIEHICDIAGNTKHVAIGTDLDGGFGYEQTPRELNKYSDIKKLIPILSSRGFSEDDINAVFHSNWIRVLRSALPE